MPTDTTPATVGIVADSQLKDQRIPFPDPGSAATQARGPELPAHKLPPGLPFDHLDPVLVLPVRPLPLLSEGNC